MRKLGVLLLLVAVFAVLAPTAVSTAQSAGAADCGRGVIVEGRCLSVDQQASLCGDDAAACVEYVGDPGVFCPVNAVLIVSEEGTLQCLRQEPPNQGPDVCPDGARGTAGSCFIYQAVGPLGCLGASVLDQDSNCRRPVQDAQGFLFCDRPEAVVDFSNLTCVSITGTIPSPCLGQTTQFDGVCWWLNGLTASESCVAYGLEAVTVESGLCQVPEPIPSGPSTCTVGTTYLEAPDYYVFDEAFVGIVAEGASMPGCVELGFYPGASIGNCFFLDTSGFGDYGDPEGCTRFAEPVQLTCPSGHSLDDSLGGLCGRVEPSINGGCASEAELRFGFCLFSAEFAVFECPAGTERRGDSAECDEHRPPQFAASCAGEGLAESIDPPINGAVFTCHGFVGPQPDQCNALGTVDDCFTLRQPTLDVCTQPSGCVQSGDFEVLGDVSCDAEVSLLDALMIAQGAAATRTEADRCEGISAATEFYGADGDVDGDTQVNAADAQRILDCTAAAGIDLDNCLLVGLT